jgi:hypothetical protein
MKIYDSAVNATDLQVQSGCSALLIEITKAAVAGYASLFEFFNEQTSASADTIKLMLNDGALGQKTVSSGLRALPLFLMSAVTPNSIQAIGKEMEAPAYEIDPKTLVLSKEGKKVKAGSYSYSRSLGVVPQLALITVRALLRIGFDGALALNQNRYLSLSTTFSDLANMKVYAIDGRKTDRVIKYESFYMQPSTNTDISLRNSLLFALPKSIDQAVIQTLPAADSVPYSAVYSEPELAAMARDMDSCLVEVGCEDVITVTPPAGEAYSYPLGFRSQFIMSDGYGYDVIGSANYDNAKVMTNHAGHSYVCRQYSIDELPS